MLHRRNGAIEIATFSFRIFYAIMKKQVKINGLEKGKEREDMKKKKQKTACRIVCCRYCGRYRSTGDDSGVRGTE